MRETEASARKPGKPSSELWYLVAGLGATGAVVATIGMAAPQPAQAMPAYSTKTGLSCDKCHVNPTGGAELTDYGKAFQANGDQVPKGK